MANTMIMCFSAEGEQSRPRDGGPMRGSALSSAYGVAPDAHVIADGQTAETCGHKANILKQ